MIKGISKQTDQSLKKYEVPLTKSRESNSISKKKKKFFEMTDSVSQLNILGTQRKDDRFENGHDNHINYKSERSQNRNDEKHSKIYTRNIKKVQNNFRKKNTEVKRMKQ